MYNLDAWTQEHSYNLDHVATARVVLETIRHGAEVLDAVRRNPLPGGKGHIAKHMLVAVYHQLVESGEWQEDPALLARIRMKPVRTLSGVTTVTVLTKPYPCPGECIFCPTDVRMPKSYLPDEPGAARAYQNDFDPYKQVQSRLEAYAAVGHPTDKIELLILGGTWSSYRKDYQAWFVRRCFDALNGVETDSLEEAQRINEMALRRNVGLVIETRPDRITPRELAWLRRLGVTKVQMGVQSLDNHILELNRRGHTIEAVQKATALLRAAGFKIVLHWMPNLLGATTDSDRLDFARLWETENGGLGLCPDEIKIYPTQLLANAELYQYWLRGEYHPYTTQELIDLIADVKPSIPAYCRVNRVIRDIPSTHVVEGNRRTSLRQDVLAELARRGQRCRCIRCREVGPEKIDPKRLQMNDLVYRAGGAEEHFLSYDTPDGRLAGYLRLSLPKHPALSGAQHPALLGAQHPAPSGAALTTAMPAYGASPSTPVGALPPKLGEGRAPLAELEGAALIREVHVYGQSLAVGAEQAGAAQHIGLGTRLLQRAEEIAAQRGFQRMAVIAAVGTRMYYERRGFTRGELYMLKNIEKNIER